jgi:hypothetical protein
VEAVKVGSSTRITERSWEAYKATLPRVTASKPPRAA